VHAWVPVLHRNDDTHLLVAWRMLPVRRRRAVTLSVNIVHRAASCRGAARLALQL
jgi:hypothetical protein